VYRQIYKGVDFDVSWEEKDERGFCMVEGVRKRTWSWSWKLRWIQDR